MTLFINEYPHLQIKTKSKRLMQNQSVETIMFSYPNVVRDSYHFKKNVLFEKQWISIEEKWLCFGWILIWDENIVVIDTKTTYFVNKSDFQYKIIVVRGRDIDLFRHNCRNVFKNHRKLGEKKISDKIRAEVRILQYTCSTVSLHLVKENNENDLPFCQRNVPVERRAKLMT